MNSMLRVWMFGMIAGTAVAMSAAEPLLKVGAATDFRELKAELKDNGGAVVLAKRVTVTTKQAVPVDPSKSYQVSGQFRLSPGTEGPGKIYFGVVSCDGKDASINPNNVFVIPETETTLVSPAKAEELSIKVKDASAWKTDSHKYAAFNAKPDFSDLPNRTLSSPIEKIQKQNGYWEVTFKSALGRTLPAGTAVRQHSDGRGAVYAGAEGGTVTGEWKTFTGKISGLAKSGNPAEQWWAGTKKARIIVVGASKNTSIEFKDIQLTPVD